MNLLNARDCLRLISSWGIIASELSSFSIILPRAVNGEQSAKLKNNKAVLEENMLVLVLDRQEL